MRKFTWIFLVVLSFVSVSPVQAGDELTEGQKATLARMGQLLEEIEWNKCSSDTCPGHASDHDRCVTRNPFKKSWWLPNSAAYKLHDARKAKLVNYDIDPAYGQVQDRFFNAAGDLAIGSPGPSALSVIIFGGRSALQIICAMKKYLGQHEPVMEQVSEKDKAKLLDKRDGE